MTPRTWPAGLFRLTTTVAAVLACNQAVFAGQFLSGTYVALRLHRDGSTYTVAAVASTVLAAVLWRRLGRGPAWPIPATMALVALTAVQTFLGYRLVLAVHIPLGVTVIMLLIALTVAGWRRGPVRSASVRGLIASGRERGR
ncbi:hypothetical protein KOI35_03155 [Actinoplanes bogorensis]|uniref:Integral membrane protein n=1 Tax=Paractinoplanes bogorensis TaxID=1610840 RepID=A0ABS5YG88_9ACTN|nr:hypothetical protein [Actinoplanes bogorensis]MBU2662499.1 hypothetical protein [Actinoplanes bogorensis]